MSIVIRKAQNNDIKILSKLATDSFVHAYTSTLSEEKLLKYSETAFSPETLERIIIKDTVIYLVAVDNKNILGYTHLEPLPIPHIIPSCKSPIEMVRLYTKVGYEGREIGSHLLRNAVSLCKQSNYDYLWLQVWEGNKKAQHFYESNRFESLGTQNYVAKCLSRPVIIMGQTIDILFHHLCP